MVNSVIYNKIESVERCINRINEVYDNNFENLKDYTKQDSIILNIERACQAIIDIAMIIVSEKALGIPQNSRDAFEVLYEHKLIDKNLLKKLKAMVGFRNIAVHNYTKLNIDIVKNVIETHVKDFKEFTEKIIDIL